MLCSSAEVFFFFDGAVEQWRIHNLRIRPTVLIADDHAAMIEAFRSLLEPEYQVVGSARDGRELVSLAKTIAPDVVLVDLGLSYVDGAAAGERVKQLLPDTKLVVVTMQDDLAVVKFLIEHWASAYVLKSSAATELTTAVQEVLQGRVYLSSSIAQRLNRKQS